MKKYLSIILINVLAITLSGCGSSGDAGCCSDASIKSKITTVDTGSDTTTVVANPTDYASVTPPALGTNSVNRVPVGVFSNFTTGVNVAYCGQLTAKDDDHDKLTFQVVDKPSHGILEVDESGAFTYVPEQGYEGSDSFSYTASDDVSTSDKKNVSITVEGTNKDVPYAPSDLKLKVNEECSVDVEWTDNSDNEDGFSVYVNDEYKKGVGANITETTLCGLDTGVDYEIKVEAANEAGHSDPISDEITIGSASVKPNRPIDFHVKQKDEESIRFKWEHVNGASCYELHQDGVLVETISGDTHCVTVNNLATGKQYTFELKAVNDEGKSAPSILKVELSSD